MKLTGFTAEVYDPKAMVNMDFATVLVIFSQTFRLSVVRLLVRGNAMQSEFLIGRLTGRDFMALQRNSQTKTA
jgi:pyruvate/2-oxoglutarate/acetoin dehydrogenase E1 component